MVSIQDLTTLEIWRVRRNGRAHSIQILTKITGRDQYMIQGMIYNTRERPIYNTRNASLHKYTEP